jgi:hypothetical protein
MSTVTLARKKTTPVVNARGVVMRCGAWAKPRPAAPNETEGPRVPGAPPAAAPVPKPQLEALPAVAPPVAAPADPWRRADPGALLTEFFVVWSPSEARPKHRHGTLEGARAEARRLALVNPSKDFLTYRVSLVPVGGGALEHGTEVQEVRP